MDLTTILIILFIAFLFYCEKYMDPIKKKEIKEEFYNNNIKNFYNFKTLNRPPMPSPYQCVLDFNCTQGRPSDKYGNVCKRCVADTFPANIVMARNVGTVRRPRKLY